MSKTNGTTVTNRPTFTPTPAAVDPATAELMAQIAAMKAENEALKAERQGGGKSLSLKVSEKGALSVYGLSRFPVTLYAEQWDRLLDFADNIRAFRKANATRFSTKADKAAK